MLKTLGRETKGFRLVSILTPIFMICEVIMEMIIPKLMASIIDDGVTPGNMQVIYIVGAQMIVAALFGLLFGILGAVLGSHAATGFARNLRRGMFKNIQTFSFANIDKYSTAGLVTRMTTDVTNIQNAYQMLLRMSIRAPASMIVALIMSYTINRQLANIYLIAVILLGCVLVYSRRGPDPALQRDPPRQPALCALPPLHAAPRRTGDRRRPAACRGHPARRARPV